MINVRWLKDSTKEKRLRIVVLSNKDLIVLILKI